MTRSWTRRETLVSFLGAGILTTGCSQSSSSQPLPPGEVVGASDQLGHRIRELDWQGEANKIGPPVEKKKVIVVGGGIAGLAAARKLAKAGVQDQIILELEPKAGGTAQGSKSDVCGMPWGAHYVPAPRADNQPLIHLMKELEVFEGDDEEGNPIVKEEFSTRDPDERLFYKGEWYEGLYLHAGATQEDLNQFERFQKTIQDWVAWRDADGNRAFTLPLAHCSNSEDLQALDRISMADWLQQNEFDSERLLWYVDYACRDDYGLRTHQTSAWAALFYFASRMDENGKSRPFITWPEGNGRIVEHLARKLSKKLMVGWAVLDIQQLPDQRWTVLALNSKSQIIHRFISDQIVFAAPRFLAPYMLRSWRDSAPKHVSAFRYGAWAVVNLTLSRAPKSFGFPMAWDNVLHDSPSLGYVSASFQNLRDHGPQQWTYYYPLCDDDERQARTRLLENDRDAWVDVALTDLGRAHPDLREVVTRADVMRWGHAMIQPRPGFIFGDDRSASLQPLAGLYFAHSDMSGVALFEEAFYRGTLAAEHLLRDLNMESEREYLQDKPNNQLM